MLRDGDCSAVITISGHLTTNQGNRLLCGIAHVAIVNGRMVLDGAQATTDPALVGWVRSRLFGYAGIEGGRVADVDGERLFEYAPLAVAEPGQAPDEAA